MSVENMPQIPVPEIPKDSGNRIWAMVGQGIDNMMNAIIESAGNLMGAVVTKGPGMLMDAVGSATATVSSAATAPFKDFVASNSPEIARGATMDGPGRGQSREVDGVGSAPSVKTIEVSGPSFQAIEAIRNNAALTFAMASVSMGADAQHGVAAGQAQTTSKSMAL